MTVHKWKCPTCHEWRKEPIERRCLWCQLTREEGEKIESGIEGKKAEAEAQAGGLEEPLSSPPETKKGG